LRSAALPALPPPLPTTSCPATALPPTSVGLDLHGSGGVVASADVGGSSGVPSPYLLAAMAAQRQRREAEEDIGHQHKENFFMKSSIDEANI